MNHSETKSKNIILASSSNARKLLLECLHLPFEQHAPNVDETPLPNEHPEVLVERLAHIKAQAVVNRLQPDHTILIASDQVAFFADAIIGKPHTETQATKQLLAFSGQSVTFYTSLCVYDTTDQSEQTTVEQTQVNFRKLTHAEVEGYVRIDQPLNASGGFRAEGLGVTLFKSIASRDPNSLIGLPLMQLACFLKQAGVNLY